MSSIELTGVTKIYPGAGSASVESLSLRAEEGDFLCLLGPSGCGKTTTLRMIAGLETPSSGRISIGDAVVDDVEGGRRIDAEHRRLGLVFQNYALWPHMTVRDNVGFGPAMQRLSRGERQQRVQEALWTLAIAEYTDRYPAELSGGQQQRVAIARTVAARPNVMLLDEPLSNLDARLRLEMRAEFQRIHRETGSTMLFVTHDQWEAMTLATRIVVMDRGKVQQVGAPLEIYEQPANRFVAQFMGSPPINMIEGSGAAASALAAELPQLLGSAADAAVSAGIRPEALRFSPTQDEVPDGVFAVPVTVTGVLPTGGSWIVETTDGERRIFATSSVMPGLSTGDRAVAWAWPEDLHLFDDDGVRVEPGGVQTRPQTIGHT